MLDGDEEHVEEIQPPFPLEMNGNFLFPSLFTIYNQEPAHQLPDMPLMPMHGQPLGFSALGPNPHQAMASRASQNHAHVASGYPNIVQQEIQG